MFLAAFLAAAGITACLRDQNALVITRLTDGRQYLVTGNEFVTLGGLSTGNGAGIRARVYGPWAAEISPEPIWGFTSEYTLTEACAAGPPP